MDKPKNTIAKELDLIRGNTCEYACKYLEKCYRDNKDPDDAEDDLLEYCANCPLLKLA